MTFWTLLEFAVIAWRVTLFAAFLAMLALGAVARIACVATRRAEARKDGLVRACSRFGIIPPLVALLALHGCGAFPPDADECRPIPVTYATDASGYTWQFTCECWNGEEWVLSCATPWTL